ncbi:MAG: molybdenum cofactor guanylyltransferase MobA [Lautropia sp.]|nr:molybdenum cofactor guanylyltransferase MobA [Lautropia sp.]
MNPLMDKDIQIPPRVAGVILAGGSARRMQTGGHAIDKGLLLLGDLPLVLWQIRQLAPQVNHLLVNANRHLPWYQRFGYPVIPDRFPGQPGPLAGIHAALLATDAEWLAVTACDTPFTSPDWVGQLLTAARHERRWLAHAADPTGRAHPLLAVVHRSLLASLTETLTAGQHRVQAFYRQHDALIVPFEHEAAFFNINTPDAWHEATRIMSTTTSTPFPAEMSLSRLEQAEHGFDPRAVPVAQARVLIARYVPTPVSIETVSLGESLGRILASAIEAPFDLPGHDNAAMDGYALRHVDLDPTADSRLPVAGRTLAGDAPAPVLPAGQAQRIMTGAPMPVGADTVVMQEDVRLLEGEAGHADAAADATGACIVVSPGVRAGQHVRRRGEDMRTGDVALPAGRRLTPADIGVAASLGLSSLPVWRRLRIGCLSTGNELKQLGEQRADAQIFDSNRHTLLAMARQQGFEAVDLGALPDQPDALRTALIEAATRVDVILTTGGAAAGDADLIQQVTDTAGEARAWKLRLRPGRPLIVGRIGPAILFGLPGNPVAAFISYRFIIGDALRQMAGAAPETLQTIRARAGAPFEKKAGRTEYQRVRLHRDEQGRPVATVNGSQSSAMMRTLADADGVAVLPEALGPVAEGDWIDVIPLHGLMG